MCVDVCQASFFVAVLYLYEELVELIINDVYSCSICSQTFSFNECVVMQL